MVYRRRRSHVTNNARFLRENVFLAFEDDASLWGHLFDRAVKNSRIYREVNLPFGRFHFSVAPRASSSGHRGDIFTLFVDRIHGLLPFYTSRRDLACRATVDRIASPDTFPATASAVEILKTARGALRECLENFALRALGYQRASKQ